MMKPERIEAEERLKAQSCCTTHTDEATWVRKMLCHLNGKKRGSNGVCFATEDRVSLPLATCRSRSSKLTKAKREDAPMLLGMRDEDKEIEIEVGRSLTLVRRKGPFCGCKLKLCKEGWLSGHE